MVSRLSWVSVFSPSTGNAGEKWYFRSLHILLGIVTGSILFVLAVNFGMLNRASIFNRPEQDRKHAELSNLEMVNATIANILEDRLSSLLSTVPVKSTSEVNENAEPPAAEMKKARNKLDELRERQGQVDYSAVWMSDIEIDVILRYLNNIKTYIEWGSGGSTRNFAKFATLRAHSVEHDQKWCESMKKHIADSNELTRVHLHCVPVTRGTRGWNVNPNSQDGTYFQFQPYVDVIDSLNETIFDVVLDDGRARVAVAIKVLSYISDESVVVLHDASRIYSSSSIRGNSYALVLKYYDTIELVLGQKRQGVAILRRKSTYKHLQGNHAIVTRILEEEG